MKQSFGITLGVAALVISTGALAISQPMSVTPGAADPAMGASSDAQFVRAVQQSNDEEIAASRYVLGMSKNPMVREFAMQMISDHSLSDVSLQTAARNAHVHVPGRTRMVDVPPSLQSYVEPRLDGAYMRQQIAAHSDALAVVRTEATSGKDPGLRAFAASQVSVVQAHLDRAANYVDSLPMRSNTSSSAAPVLPGGQSSGNGLLIPPPSPQPRGSASPNPQPSVGIPGTVPNPGPSRSPN